jgi:hypothetical protein
MNSKATAPRRAGPDCTSRWSSPPRLGEPSLQPPVLEMEAVIHIFFDDNGSHE